MLSSSTDSSVILWSQTSIGGYTTTNSASIWVSEQRFGDVGGQRLGGFVGCLWSQGGDRAMAWGWAGGWRSWLSNSDKNGIESWTEVGAISGHRGIVRDVNWSPGGEYLISTGCSDSSDGYIFGTNVPTVQTKQRAYTHQSVSVSATARRSLPLPPVSRRVPVSRAPCRSLASPHMAPDPRRSLATPPFRRVRPEGGRAFVTLKLSLYVAYTSVRL